MVKCIICGYDNPDTATFCQQCGSSLAATPMGALSSDALPNGTSLQQGKFVLEKVLGQGGFGITYKGTDQVLQRQVAIKEFFPADCQRVGKIVQPTARLNPAAFVQMRQRFLKEARALAQFNHPGIVQVYDVFEENNTAYMVMEFLDGKSLRDLLLSRGGVLREDEALDYIVRVAEALKVVHQKGLVHLDIKPDNIMVTNDGRVILVDFGLARHFAAQQSQSLVAYTLGYAPPEQHSSQVPIGPYTDIYALGATLYHLVTGQVPIDAMDRLNGVDLKPPHMVNFQISKQVSDAIMRAMELTPAQRFQSVDEFLDALKPSPQLTPPQPIPVQTPPSSPPPSSPQLTPPQPIPVKTRPPLPSGHFLVRQVGEKLGKVAGALSGAVVGLGIGLLIGALVFMLGAIVGLVAGSLGGAVLGALGAQGEEGWIAVLIGLVLGGALGYMVGAFVGMVVAPGIGIASLIAGGVKGVRLGQRVGAGLSERMGVVPSGMLLGGVTSALIAMGWTGLAMSVAPADMAQALGFMGLFVTVGAFIGGLIGYSLLWHSIKNSGWQMPSKDQMIALITIPIGIVLTLLLLQVIPRQWLDLAALGETWSGKVKELSMQTRRAPTLTPVPEQPTLTPVQEQVKIMFVQKNANVRSGPGKQFSVIRVLKKGTAVQVIGISADSRWAKIKMSDGKIGYISLELLGTSKPE